MKDKEKVEDWEERFEKEFVQPWVEFDARHTPDDVIAFISQTLAEERARIREKVETLWKSQSAHTAPQMIDELIAYNRAINQVLMVIKE